MALRSFVSALTVGLGLALAHPAAAQEITIATEGAYPPWNSVDPAGKPIGFEVDLANALCAKMKADCRVVTTAWDGIIPGLDAGKYDVIMAGMSITEERKKQISFSVPYARVPVVFAAAKDSDLVSGLDAGVTEMDLGRITPEKQAAIDTMKEALDGLSVGVQGATVWQSAIETYFGDVVDLRTYDTAENMALDLSTQRLDAVFTDKSFVNDFIKSDEGQDVAVVGPDMTGGPLGEGVGCGIRKADAALAERFTKAIQEATADGTIRNLSDKWFGFDVTPKPSA